MTLPDLFMLANKMGYEDADLSLETLDGIFEYTFLLIHNKYANLG